MSCCSGGVTIITVATASDDQRHHCRPLVEHEPGEEDHHQRGPEQCVDGAGHDAGDEDRHRHAGEDEVERQRDADRGEDERERRPAEEPALESDAEQGELADRHHQQQCDAVAGRAVDDRLHLGLAGEHDHRGEDADEAEDHAGDERPQDDAVLEPAEEAGRDPHERRGEEGEDEPDERQRHHEEGVPDGVALHRREVQEVHEPGLVQQQEDGVAYAAADERGRQRGEALLPGLGDLRAEHGGEHRVLQQAVVA